jgi:hypothetical protein
VIESFAKAAPRETIYALADYEFENRQYLDCTVDYVLANYAETNTEEKSFGRITATKPYSQSYIIPCFTEDDESFRFISAEVVYDPYIEEFNKIYDLTYSDNEADFQSYALEFYGRVEKLDPQMLEFAFQGMLQSGVITNRTEFDEIFLPYNIVVSAPNANGIMVKIIFSIALIAVGATAFIRDVMKARRKAANAAAARFNNDYYNS